MSQPVRYTFAASNTASICALQTLAGAGSMVLNGSGCELNPTARFRLTGTGFARPVTLTSAGNISGVNFTITGTDIRGAALTETIAGPNANTVSTTGNFYTVTSITTDGAVGTNTSAGTGTTGVSQWYLPNYLITPVNIGLGINISGTINWTVRQTTANPQTAEPATTDVIDHSDTNLVGQTVTRQGNYAMPFGGCKLVVNSSSGGSLTFDIYQAGIV